VLQREGLHDSYASPRRKGSDAIGEVKQAEVLFFIIFHVMMSMDVPQAPTQYIVGCLGGGPGGLWGARVFVDAQGLCGCPGSL